jgi:hypothetical protein
MRESGVRMVREKAMDGFFNNLLDLPVRGSQSEPIRGFVAACTSMCAAT